MFTIVQSRDIRTELNGTLKDKNLVVTISRNGTLILSDYALLDKGGEVSDVFKDFNNEVIGLLADYLHKDQQDDELTFVISRNNIVVYEFATTFKLLRKNVRTVYKLEANKIIQESGIIQTKAVRDNVINQMHDQTTTIVLLSMFSIIAVRANSLNISYVEYTEQKELEVN